METNSLRDHKGSISLRAQETGSGFRFFFDDDEESYFDLNLEKMTDSEEFEFQISFSPLPAAAAGFSAQQHPAEDLFRNGRILPLQGLQVVEARSSLVPKYGDQQVYPAERLPLESSAPAGEGAAGGVDQKGKLDMGSEKGQGIDSIRQCKEEKQQQGPAGTRKTSKVTTKKINNGMMKFLIKFPSEKIRSTFMSIMKSYHLLSLQAKRGQGEGGLAQERGGMYKRLVMQFSRWFSVRKRSHNKRGKNSTTGGVAPQRPSDVDLDEDVVRSILEAVDFTVGSRSRGAAASSGGPRQMASSPRGSQKEVEVAVERNSSISSAIAHCKMSYGNTAR